MIDTTSKTHTPKANIRVYNTLSRSKEPLETVQPSKVGMYLCGPTVYKEAHIGHMVGPVIFDSIKRYLTYNGYEVNWIVNITDVDDKLIGQSKIRDIPMSQIATEMTMDYCANLLALGVDQITHMPRATDHIDEIIAFIEELIASDYAYAVDGDVFFDVQKDTHYGKLSNRSADSQQGEGGGAAARKRAPGDFALWKGAKPGEPSWDSPWGLGRPGWHIECSAMSRRLLGKTFDIHGGGLDLIFPHHENELAQSECCHQATMARYWMHNGLLRAGEAGKIGGRGASASETDTAAPVAAAGKMSRSQGAGGLRSLIARRGGENLRFFLLRTHYRSTVVFSDEALDESAASLEKFYVFFQRYQRITGQPFYLETSDQEERRLVTRRADGDAHATAGDAGIAAELASMRDRFLAAMDDDFNTGAAISELFQMLTLLNRAADQMQLEEADRRKPEDLQAFLRGVETLRELAGVLGLFLKAPAAVAKGDADALADQFAQILIDLRNRARQTKDFGTADLVRDELKKIGVILEDRKGQTHWRKE